MNVQLSPDSMQFVEGLVASGQFESAEAVVAAGVQLLKSQQQLRAEIQKGINELDAGQGIDGDFVFSELRERNRSKSHSNRTFQFVTRSVLLRCNSLAIDSAVV